MGCELKSEKHYLGTKTIICATNEENDDEDIIIIFAVVVRVIAVNSFAFIWCVRYTAC